MERMRFIMLDTLNPDQKASCEIDPDSGFPKYRSGEAVVRVRDGRVLSRCQDIVRQDRAPEAAVVQKFMDNTAVCADARARNGPRRNDSNH